MTTEESNTHVTGLSDEDVEQFFSLPAMFDQKMMKELEASASTAGIQQCRRLSLAVLTRSIPELLDVSHSDADVYSQMLRGAQDFKDHLESLLRLATAAVLRLEIADERTVEVQHG